MAFETPPPAEISALALLLVHLEEGAELELSSPDAELEVLPTAVGKTTVKHEEHHGDEA